MHPVAYEQQTSPNSVVPRDTKYKKIVLSTIKSNFHDIMTAINLYQTLIAINLSIQVSHFERSGLNPELLIFHSDRASSSISVY